MQIFKRAISIFLAAQLLVSLGLCGGLCCVKSAELSAPEVVAQTAEEDEKLPPCHRKKAAEQKVHQQHQQHQAKKLTAIQTVLNRDCCAMKRDTPDEESLPSTVAPEASKLAAVFAASFWDGEIVNDLPPVPIQISTTHSPPHTGFQLSLRI